ncbi:GNAT family N-acetyltransferase [Sphingomonas sp. SUN039]|uniref:GNAT family N-acetyltransferase n=1 Tax=Sphingomonas sp. SUN039 TaxID=2937787 RepID=UPI002164120E|nr:GNAT family N-acetyltransferase [Sphingomonas sp. SUN039]UVO54597.1 GNAT family N-acetyltransferase [Sphingomonas sp. SUN039]
MSGFHHRIATEADIPAIRDLMARAIAVNQTAFLTPAQIALSHSVMGLDTQIIADGTYFLIERGETLVGCGGWSARATLYGGDASIVARDPAPLDPAKDAARVRAMYTDPTQVRQGIGRMILDLCEGAARAAGFSRTEMMATLSGEPLYRACGYLPIEYVQSPPVDGVSVPLIRMGKTL